MKFLQGIGLIQWEQSKILWKFLWGMVLGVHLWVTHENHLALQVQCHLWHKPEPSSIAQLIHQSWLWLLSEGKFYFWQQKAQLASTENLFSKFNLLSNLFYKESRYILSRQHRWNIGIISCGDYLEEKVSGFAEGLAPYLIRPVTRGQIGPVNRITVFKVKCFEVDFFLWLLLLMWPWLIWEKMNSKLMCSKWGQG